MPLPKGLAMDHSPPARRRRDLVALRAEIEVVRRLLDLTALTAMTLRYGELQNPKVLDLSRRLDRLLTEYQRATMQATDPADR